MPPKQIFIQIASYRDPELAATLSDLISKAHRPEQLRIGICLQINPADQTSCGRDSLPHGETLRGAELLIDEVAASDSHGVCWARARTQQLWSGEPFTLQIDSHMRCIDGWDVELLASWQRCNDPRAILSCYPNAFSPPDQLDQDFLPLLSALHFDEQGILRLRGFNSFRYPDQCPKAPLPSAFIAAGLLFGPSSLIDEVPYDPQLYFYGEEISLALRLWTRGFNFYNPDRLLLFHLYKAAGQDHITHWADHSDWSSLNQRSLARIQALLQGHDIETPYGLGDARSLQSYENWSGVSFSTATLSDDARLGRFNLPPASTGSPTAGSGQ